MHEQEIKIYSNGVMIEFEQSPIQFVNLNIDLRKNLQKWEFP